MWITGGFERVHWIGWSKDCYSIFVSMVMIASMTPTVSMSSSVCVSVFHPFPLSGNQVWSSESLLRVQVHEMFCLLETVLVLAERTAFESFHFA